MVAERKRITGNIKFILRMVKMRGRHQEVNYDDVRITK